MTLVLNSKLGRIVQTQLGVNEIASCVIVGKAIGSLFTRQSDAAVFTPLAREYGLFVRELPKYLHNVELDRPGSFLASNQRRVQASSVLEDVTLDSIEGIATFLVLILRHVEATGDLVDYVESLLQGKYWIIGPAESHGSQKKSLPYSLRTVLRSFVTSLVDADADSPQLNQVRQSMSELVAVVGSSLFLETTNDPSQCEQDRFLHHLLGDPQSHPCDDSGSNFHTLSAKAAMIALAAASNGANVVVQCRTPDGGSKTLSKAKRHPRGSEHTFVLTLWLTKPPPDIAWILKSYQGREDFEPRTLLTGPIPIFGGVAEIARSVGRRFGCEASQEEQVALWETSVLVGKACAWEASVISDEAQRSLILKVDSTKLLYDIQMPADLTHKAQRHFKAVRGDPRHNLARKAASVLHETLNYPSYDGFAEARLKPYIELIVVAFFVGCIECLVSPSSSQLSFYAWTAECTQLMGYAESMVSQGLSTERLILTAARIWGGLPPSFTPIVPSNVSVMGIVCPQTTIMLNVLSDPVETAHWGLTKGLFTLHRGSIPMIPRDQLSGLIFAGEKPFRKPIRDVDASCQIPMETEKPTEPEIMFTLEPGTTEMGIFSVLICGWMYGSVLLELNPFVVLSGLIGERHLERMASWTGDLRERVKLNHMSSKELLCYTDGFKIRGGSSLIRTGSRLDLQVAAAGCHLGPRTVMIVADEDAALIREHQRISGPSIELHLPYHTGQQVPENSVFVFCCDQLPDHLGSSLETIEEQA